METYKLHIKNMVCPRCISTVTQILQQQGLEPEQVALGEAEIKGRPENLPQLETALQEQGFELLLSRDQQLAEQVKTLLIEYLHDMETAYSPVTTSVYLAEKLNQPYQHLSKLFSKEAGLTIEKYFIRLKIERVKELLSYQELTLSEIAHRLRYSSVQHLSNQFKKITGISVSDYKQGAALPRTPLDSL